MIALRAHEDGLQSVDRAPLPGLQLHRDLDCDPPRGHSQAPPVFGDPLTKEEGDAEVDEEDRRVARQTTELSTTAVSKEVGRERKKGGKHISPCRVSPVYSLWAVVSTTSWLKSLMSARRDTEPPLLSSSSAGCCTVSWSCEECAWSGIVSYQRLAGIQEAGILDAMSPPG